jgi:hypothetical protein
MPDDVVARLGAVERRWRILAGVQGAMLLCLIAVLTSGWSGVRLAAQDQKVLTLSELTVVDAKGTVRARIGGELPDDVIDGKPVPRGQHAAGVLLYDEAGRERSGYVTFSPSGNVALTLDNQRTQTALFAAGPDGGSALRLWYHDHAVELNVGADGPFIHATENKRAAFHQPPVRNPESTEMCKELRQARSQMSDAKLLELCVNRWSEAACRACLARK